MAISRKWGRWTLGWQSALWSVGLGVWRGKPLLSFERAWCDGDVSTLHVGLFWFEVVS